MPTFFSFQTSHVLKKKKKKKKKSITRSPLENWEKKSNGERGRKERKKGPTERQKSGGTRRRA